MEREENLEDLRSRKTVLMKDIQSSGHWRPSLSPQRRGKRRNWSSYLNFGSWWVRKDIDRMGTENTVT